MRMTGRSGTGEYSPHPDGKSKENDPLPLVERYLLPPAIESLLGQTSMRAGCSINFLICPRNAAPTAPSTTRWSQESPRLRRRPGTIVRENLRAENYTSRRLLSKTPGHEITPKDLMDTTRSQFN